MDPITLSLIAAGGTLLINAYAAYQKGELSEDEYRRASKAADELERKLKALRPDETWQNIDPQLLIESAKYAPEIASFVEENAPQIIQEADSATEKRIQRQALKSYAAQAETGRDVISEAQQEQAQFETDARSKSRRNQLMDSLRRQGALGSGAGLVAQLEGEQSDAQAARAQSLEAVQGAEMRRRDSIGKAAGLAGQIRSQNTDVESANVGTMNSFNQRLANAKNLYNRYASGERNQAQELNQNREISRTASNINTGNKYAMYNREQTLNARERARQFDQDLVNRMFDARSGAERNRYAGNVEKIGDYATAVNSAVGAGASVYSAANAPSKSSLLESAKQGAADQIARQSVNQGVNLMDDETLNVPYSPTRREYGLGIQYDNDTALKRKLKNSR